VNLLVFGCVLRVFSISMARTGLARVACRMPSDRGISTTRSAVLTRVDRPAAAGNLTTKNLLRSETLGADD